MVSETVMRHGGNVWEGGDPSRWLDFSANLRAGGVPPWVMQTLRDALENARYYPDRSMRAAKRGLAAYAGVEEDRVLPTAGGMAAIDEALSRRRGAVCLDMPTFGGYGERAAALGRAVRPWAGVCRPGDTVVLCNPNNPTGTALSCCDVLALAERVNRQGGELLVDEAFIDFCAENTVRRHVRPGLIVVGSLTKTLCIPGVRLGYVCAAPEMIAQMQKRMPAWPLGALATAVAERLPEHLAEIRADAAENRVRREEMARELTRIGARVAPSQANFLLADFGRDMTWTAARLKGSGVLVRTCASFGLSAQHLRLAVKTGEENRRLIALLEGEEDAR